MTEEVQNEVEVNPVNPLASMIDNIMNSEFNTANNIFGDILGSKIQDALEQEKIAMANVVFNNVEEDEEEQLDLDFDDEDITDEDLEAAAEDLLDDE